MKVHKGDSVKIIVGKDSGKTGKVLSVDYKTRKVFLEGLNLFKKHVKPKRQGEKGEMIQVARPVDVSNLMVICQACKKATRVGYRIDNKDKARICKKCQAAIK